MSFEGHTILPSQKISNAESSSLKDFSQLNQILSREESVTPGCEIENDSDTEDFEIYTKTGLSNFYTFLKSEQESKDSLDADLDIVALDLPKGVEASLRQVRIEYADLIRLVTEVLDTAGEDVSEEAVLNVHEQYTSYIEAQDILAELYSAYLNSETAPTETKETADIDTDPEPAQETDIQRVSETSIEPVETIETSENIEKLRTAIEEDWMSVRHLHDSLHGSFPKEKRGPAQEVVLSQLADYYKRASNLRQKTLEVDEMYSSNPEADLERYQNALHKIKEETVAFVENQSHEYEKQAESMVPEVVVSDTAAEDSESIEPALSVETGEEPQDTAPRVESEVDYSAAHTKVEELELMLKNHPALTPQESQTIQWSIDDLNEKMKSKAGESLITQAIEIADSLTVSEVTEPGYDALREKAEILIEKARHMTSTHLEEKETVQAMVANLERATQAYETGEDNAVEKVQQAYKNVENFMTENEALWLKVCGMNVPQAGPDGAFAARSFRDGLELAKRNHPDIKASPEKAAVADQIIQLIFVVPDAGLTDEQVGKVTELAKELAIYDSTVVARLRTKKASETNPVSNETSVQFDAASETETENTEAVENGRDSRKRPADAVAQKHAQNERGKYFKSKTNDMLANTKASMTSWMPEKMKRNGAMKVKVDGKDDGDIKITVAEKVQEVLQDKDESMVGVVEEFTQSATGKKITADLERKDSTNNSINNSIPSKVDRDLIKKEALKERSLVGKYLLKDTEYTTFFAEHSLTPEDFERQLQTTIKSIDTKEIDFWEAKFDTPFKSAFSHLQNMSLEDIAQINALPPQERRKILTAENVKYEAYLAWIDILDSMTIKITVGPKTEFGELFARWMLETEMTYYVGESNASQFTL